MYSCLEATETDAHKALKTIFTNTNNSIITENIDLLHEATEIIPYRTSQQMIHAWSTTKNMQAIDILICIGLSHDDRGLIAKYIECNPHALVVAFDIKNQIILIKMI